ncbi:hypothetical protein [Brevibacillus parabrevis]|uniref:hypothetical protein n=1 Tax=Brevibacillus parabrevis TaxID=54914 RepID=UPI0028534063|nr:hypothetical protein [Brevibacillus parabrevis]MDR4997865.1 hypothetical protein [Brevibacillus parabrevis]
MDKFTPAFPELELAVTKLLNERTSRGFFATILSDKINNATGEVFSRKVVTGDVMCLHVIHQFCFLTANGDTETSGVSQDSVSVVDIRKYMGYLEGEKACQG